MHLFMIHMIPLSTTHTQVHASRVRQMMVGMVLTSFYGVALW